MSLNELLLKLQAILKTCPNLGKKTIYLHTKLGNEPNDPQIICEVSQLHCAFDQSHTLTVFIEGSSDILTNF